MSQQTKINLILLLVFCVSTLKAQACEISCPTDMVPVCDSPSPFCIDRFEYGSPDAKGRPLGYMNKFDCEQACELQGKRLLTHAEWRLACKGTVPQSCNISRENPVIRLYRAPEPWIVNGINCKLNDNRWRMACMNDPILNELDHGLAFNSEFSQCVSEVGAYHMVGNLGEWVDDPAGTFNGGLYPMPRSSCHYSTTAHGPSYSDYSIGCRCGLTP